MDEPSDPRSSASTEGAAPRASLARVAWPVAVSCATFVAGSGIGLYQLARSNRPHELTAAPWVAGLLLVSVVLAILAVRRLLAAWQARDRRPLGFAHALLALVLVPLLGFGALLFLAAAGTAIEVLPG